MRLPWVEDGLDAGEADAVEELYFVAVAHADSSVARDLVRMPFLISHEPADTHALDAISNMIRDGLTASLTSSRVYQQGVTDVWAPVVAAVGATESSSAIREYLSDNAITVETGQYITTGQPLTITIVRLKNSTALAGTMESAHRAVAGAEAVMQLPLPTRHIIIT